MTLTPKNSSDPVFKRLAKSWLAKPWLAWAAFGAAALLTLTQAFRGVFHDEGDILTVGWQLTKGAVLYQDIFSHHFPLPYFWSAGITLIFGRSLPAQRVVIFLLTTAVFYTAARFTRRPLAVSLGFLFWSLFSPLVRGNMVLYHTFGALSLYLVFILLFHRLESPASLTPGQRFLIGFTASLAMMGSVIYLYPVLIALVFLVIRQWNQQGENTWNKVIKDLWPVAAGGLILPLLFLMYLLMHQGLGDFWREGIRFNLDYYSPHINANDMSPLQILFYVATLHNPLQVLAPPLNPNWTLNYVLFIAVRLSALTAVGIMALRRQFLRAAFTYLFLAALLVRSNGPNGQPYLIIALYILPAVLTSRWLKETLSETPRRWASWAFLRKALALTGLGLLGVLFLVFGRLGVDSLANPEALTPSTNFAPLMQQVESLRAVQARCPRTEILAYPYDLYLYYLSGIDPASRYLFMFPWVDDYATPDIIATLQEDRPILVAYDLNIFYYRPEALLDFLEENYLPANEIIWHSPSLEACLAQAEPLP
jgi:hypothetical protein